MRRAIGISTVLLAAAVLVVFAVGAGGGDEGGGYRVRAIFMNAFSAIPGEDVKIAGVKVGSIESIDVTPDKKAAVVLAIDKAGFQDFRRDAECTIRPQSLIGEKYIECTPTQPRAEGTPAPPELPVVKSGPGKGQRLLPVSQTSSPVDIDLINNVMRLPYRQRFAIILNELGTGLAGRGQDLRQAIRNADPALKETDKVLQILADQNRTLEQLAVDGDRILAPLARDRARVADFVDKAGKTATATAERSAALEDNIRLLPAFLRELRPTMEKLGALSDEMTPVLSDLHTAAPDVNRFILELGPFSQAGRESFPSLGKATEVGRTALNNSKPIIRDLRDFTKPGRPLAQNLNALLTSLQKTGGIERLMDYLFFQVAAVNGYDTFGHYLRAGLILNACTDYVAQTRPDCTAKFTGPGSIGEAQAQGASVRAASVASGPGPGPLGTLVERAMELIRQGKDPMLALQDGKAAARDAKGAKSRKRRSGSGDAPLALPPSILPGGSEQPGGGASSGAGTPSSPSGSDSGTSSSASPAPSSGSGDGGGSGTTSLLEYLLGGGS
jgi:ABC-type transporter Mla subunit MlaD